MNYHLWLLFGWLVFETVWDLRSHNLPVWFSLAMLIPGIALLAIASPFVAILATVSLLSTEISRRYWLVGMAGMYIPLLAITLISPGCLPLALGWAVLMALWLANGIGGADALAGLSLLLFFPTWIMLACIVAGILIWSIVLLILRYGRSAGLRLWTVTSTRAAGTKVAGIGAYALAALIFGVYRIAEFMH